MTSLLNKLPKRNTVTLEELERIACLIMSWRTLDGKVTTWGSDIINSMMEQSKTGEVIFHVVPKNERD
jgi:hypothetical protein